MVSIGYLALTRMPESKQALSQPARASSPGIASSRGRTGATGDPMCSTSVILPLLGEWAGRTHTPSPRPRARPRRAAAALLRHGRWPCGTRRRCSTATNCSTRPALSRRRAATAAMPRWCAAQSAGAWRADAVRSPSDSGHRDRAPARQAEIPSGGVRTDAAASSPSPNCNAPSRRSPAAVCTSRISADWSRPPRWWKRPARLSTATGGRPAALFRFRRDALAGAAGARPAPRHTLGVSVPRRPHHPQSTKPRRTRREMPFVALCPAPQAQADEDPADPREHKIDAEKEFRMYRLETGQCERMIIPRKS